MRDYLKRRSEKLPSWLAEHKVGDEVNIQDFLHSRILYYPGAGSDGNPVRTLASSHCTHCFIYVDYAISKEERLELIKNPGFRGYSMIDCIDIKEFLAEPWEWTQWRNSYLREYPSTPHLEDPQELCVKSCFLGIFERIPMEPAWVGDCYGAKRFAVLFIEGDGIFAYEKIFCSDRSIPPPYMLYIDGTMGAGNYNTFRKGGLLEHIARRYHKLPIYLSESHGGSSVWGSIYSKVEAGPEYLRDNWQKRELWKTRANCRPRVRP